MHDVMYFSGCVCYSDNALSANTSYQG